LAEPLDSIELTEIPTRAIRLNQLIKQAEYVACGNIRPADIAVDHPYLGISAGNFKRKPCRS